MKAGRAIGIVAVVVVMAFAFAMGGCAGPQEEGAGAAGERVGLADPPARPRRAPLVC